MIVVNWLDRYVNNNIIIIHGTCLPTASTLSTPSM